MNRKLLTPLLISIAPVAIAGLLTGCGRAAAQTQAQTPPPPSVTVAPVTEKKIVEWEEFTGRTEPVESVEIRSRTSGYIQAVRFQSGQIVKKGEVLFVIDPRWNQAVVEQREAEFEQAKDEAGRTAALLKNNAISAEDAEARRAKFAIAKAVLDSAKLDLEYTEVRSPIEGRVSRALLTEGNYVSGVAGSASLLTTVVSVDKVFVYASVDEDSLLKFNRLMDSRKLGDANGGKIPVELELADESNFPHLGEIESFDNRVDPDTGSILMRAVFQNDDGRMTPGLFARVRIPLSERHAVLLVDQDAIGTDQANKFVLALTSSNTVAYRAVTLGPVVDGQRVIRSGLVAGQQIVVNGLQRVRPGSPVTPEPAGPVEGPKVARQ